MDKIKWKLLSTVGSTSKIYYGTGFGKELIKKEYRKTFLYSGGGSRDYAFDNEVAVLSKLSPYVHFPTLLHVDKEKEIIYMTYCGKELYQGNLPNNYLEQFNIILETMEKCNVDYRDFKLQHLRCMNNVISLIDFGASSINSKKYQRMYKWKDLNHFSH